MWLDCWVLSHQIMHQWWYVVVWAEDTYFYSIFLELVPVSRRGAWMVVCSAYWSAGTIFKASLAWVCFLSWLQTQKSLTSWSLRVCFLITYFFLDKLIRNFTQYYAGDWRRPWGFIKCQHAFTWTMSWLNWIGGGYLHFLLYHHSLCFSFIVQLLSHQVIYWLYG